MSLLDERNWLWVFSWGTLCLALAVYASTLNPPSQYELSIYAGPPWFVWLLLGCAIFVSIVLAVYGKGTASSHAAFVLSTSTVVAIATLPLLRSYEFFGRFDALNHLGTVQDMLAGVSANTTIYPAMHLLAAVIVRLTGLSPEVALLMMTPIFVFLFAFGVYLIALNTGVSRLGKALAGIVPMTMPFVIPVRLPKLQPIPTVVAILMFPLLLYLLFNSLQARRRYTLCFLILATSQVFYHPQHALVLVLGVLVGGIVLLYSQLDEPFLRPGFGLTGFLVTILTAWLYVKPSFWGAVENILVGLASDNGVVEGATPDTDSLSAVGGSLVEVGAKVFLPKLLLILALMAVSLYVFFQLDEKRLPSNKERYIVGFALAPGMFVLLFLVIGRRSQMFRYVGAGVTFVAILLIVYNSERYVPHYGLGIRHVVAVLFLLSAVVALPVAYKSPYVYQPNEHVTEGELEGFEFVLSNRHDRPLRTFGPDPDRYRNALYGRSVPPQAEEANIGGPPTASYVNNRTIREANGTFLLTEYTRARYLRLYPRLRYTEADFEYLESGPGIHKLYSNGGTTVYAGQQSPDTEP